MIHSFPNTVDGEKQARATGGDLSWSPEGWAARTGEHADPRPSAQEQIEQLESDLPRKLREVWLAVIAPTLPAGDKERVRVEKIEAQIVELRTKL